VTISSSTAEDIRRVSEADLQAIRQAALDYIEGWYEGDAARMERSLHPELAKRIILRDPRGFDRLDPIAALALVIATRNGAGTRTPPERRRKEITILDVTGNAASVKIAAAGWVDYLHIGKLNGVWQIVNVLWERFE
jgi:hypothetical protein